MGPTTLTPDFWGGLLTALQNFATWITDQFDGGAMAILMAMVSLIRNVGFITQTDTNLINSTMYLLGWDQARPLVDAILRSAMLIAAACQAGHHWFGWRAIPDSIQRWGCALILTRLTVQLQDWSVQAMDGVTHGIAVWMPDFPAITGVSPVIIIGLLVVWAVLLFRLVLVCAERIAWLVVLKPVGPLAMVFWAMPQTAWIADKYVKLWVGWLIGQFFVVLAIGAMELMIQRGGIDGYFLSCGCLVVATKAISLFVPTGDAGLLKVGPVKV